MPKITVITPAVCRNLRPEVEAAVQAQVAEAYGMTAKVGNAKYTSGSVTFSVTLAVVSEDGTVRSPEAEAYTSFAGMYGLPVDGLNKTFRNRGQVFRVIGLNTRRGKYPVLVEDLQGKRYKYPAESVAALLKAGV